MARTAALFSGQGSQYPGMGAELVSAYPRAKEIYECAGDIFGMDIIGISANSDEAELSRTAVSQPAIFALSVAAYTLAKDLYGEPDAAAGHSLGEFAALYAAGAYGLEDGFRIIKARACAMENAASSGLPGAMYAIIGSDEDTIYKICSQIDGFVEPVNLNLPSQTVISGEAEAAEKASEALASLGAKAVRLGVGSAFHTKMMLPAADEFKSAISGVKFSPVRLDFYSNLTGGRLIIDDYPEYFAKHMTSPVRFAEQVAAMARDGITACIEYGPKKTVSTLAKKNNRSLSATNVEDVKTLEALEAFYAKL